ncbi:hypothetical protein MAR_038175 [Mya arenaria]|uniref:Integrase p58-like C-terminal domain-containing protein n=1 Tax=Mya arenaria TaxID=6604 RepID=A0ABY7FZH3_MYAAR|nr:hypothetical protein MAR_038175 [Mya arenaria]
MLLAHSLARDHIGRGAKRSKEVYDTRAFFTEYNEGDLVWCLHEARHVGINPKLEKACSGPFVITSKQSRVNFVVQVDKKGKTKVFHHDKLKMYQGRSPSKWVTEIQTDMSAVSRVQYRCKRCDKVGRRYQVVAHILKAHVPIERVPFFCTRCFFRCQDRDTVWNHTERYRGHINEVKKNGPTGELKDILRASTNAWYVTDKDMVMIDCKVPSPQVVGFDEYPFQNNDGQDHTLTAPSPKGPPPPKVSSLSSLSSFKPALQPFGNVPDFRVVPLKDYLASKIPAQKIFKVQIHSGQNYVPAFSSVVQQPYDVAGHGLTYTDLESVSMFDIGPNVRQVAQSDQRNQMPSIQTETRIPSYERKRKAVEIAPTPCLDERLTELDLVMPVLQDLTDPLFFGKTPKCGEDQADNIKTPMQLQESMASMEKENIVAAIEAQTAVLLSGFQRVCKSLDETNKELCRIERKVNHLDQQITDSDKEN